MKVNGIRSIESLRSKCIYVSPSFNTSFLDNTLCWVKNKKHLTERQRSALSNIRKWLKEEEMRYYAKKYPEEVRSYGGGKCLVRSIDHDRGRAQIYNLDSKLDLEISLGSIT